MELQSMPTIEEQIEEQLQALPEYQEILKAKSAFEEQTRMMYFKLGFYTSERNGKIKYANEIKELATNIILRYNSTEKFDCFCFLSPKLPPKVYWELLSMAYTSSDNLFPFRRKVRKCFAAKHPYREYLMNEVERSFVAALPDVVTIYRGMTDKESKSGKFGLSWSLDKSIAEFFRDTYLRNFSTHNEPKTLMELQIKKSEIVAYFQKREESEIIYLG